MIASFRRTLHDRGFIEVETPVLHAEAGGAHARPFTTHHNTLDLQLYLRIALELHLKRLIVGGMERVYEIGRIFRNEGISTRHNPEFTMMELYQAFGDWNDVMDISEVLVTQAARDAIGTTVVEIRGETVDLAEPWPRMRMVDAVSDKIGRTVHPEPTDRRAAARSPRSTAFAGRSAGAAARSSKSCSRRSASPTSFARRSSPVTRSRSRRWHVSIATTRGSPSASRSSSTRANSATATPS